MAIVYVPTSFFAVIFTRTGSIFFSLVVWLRALFLVIPAVVAQCLYEYPTNEPVIDNWDLENFVTWTSVLISFLMAFRLNFAYSKWEAASQASLDLAASARVIMSRLVAYVEPTDATEEAIATVRRLLVLASVLIAKHVAADVDLSEEVEMGLLTEDELKAFSKEATGEESFVKAETRGARAGPDEKSDRQGKYFPTRGRPALVFCWLYKLVNSLLPHFPAGPDQMVSLEAELTAMSKIYERIEFLGLTIIPLAYCQLTRIASVIAVFAMAFNYESTWGWATRLTCIYVFALVLVAVDAVAAEMETPFAGRINDVDIKKIVRRTDRHTARRSPTLPPAVRRASRRPCARAAGLTPAFDRAVCRVHAASGGSLLVLGASRRHRL